MRIVLIFLPDELPVAQEPAMHDLIEEYGDVVLTQINDEPMFKVTTNKTLPNNVGKIAEPGYVIREALRRKLTNL